MKPLFSTLLMPLRMSQRMSLKMSVMISLMIASMISIMVGGCRGGGSGSGEKTYQDEKENLYATESKNAPGFLKVTGDFRKNLLGQTVIRATVDNRATVCRYKNVRVKMLFYDQNNTLFENHEEVIASVLSPGESHPCKWRYATQKKTARIAFSILGASPLP